MTDDNLSAISWFEGLMLFFSPLKYFPFLKYVGQIIFLGDILKQIKSGMDQILKLWKTWTDVFSVQDTHLERNLSARE